MRHSFIFHAALLIIIIIFNLKLFAQAGSYYDAISPAASTFITDLETRIRSPYTKISYDQYDETNITFFASRDTTGGQRVVTCVYSGENYVYTPPFTWVRFSREHTWCQSWFPTGGSTNSNEGADQYHLFPTNQNQVNGVRSNHPLGNVQTVTGTYLQAKIGTDINGNTVYEPRASHKGDAARALFYMAVRYDGIGGYNWSFNTLNTYLTTHSEGPQDLATLIAWHKQDPPDKWEVDRNNYIQSIQKNRNPFVDHPEYINYINFANITKIDPVYSTEPTNYASGFSASYSSNSLNLSWTDATPGTQAPSGYLLIAYDNNNYFVPVDGEVYSNDTNLSDGAALVNIPYSDPDLYSFSNLISDTRYYFTLYSYNGSGSQINYKINGTFPQSNAVYNGTVVVEPTVPASNLLFSNITSSSMRLTWTNGNGSSRIVVGHTDSDVNANPVDATTYSSSSVFGVGSQIGTANFVVYKGSDNSVLVTGLNSTTNYYYKVYEFNGSAGTEDYLITSPASGFQITNPVVEPTIQASNLEFSSVASTSLSLNWTNGNGSYRIILAKSGSSVNSNPVDGTTYTENSVFGIGSQIGTGNYVVYKGGENSTTISGLTPSTTYYFAIYEFDGANGNENYLTVSPASGSQLTTPSDHIIVAEVYGGGGNSGSYYTHDYIALYNPTPSDVNLSGWSVQYWSAAGTVNNGQITLLSGIIPTQGYYLIQEAQGAGGIAPLPNPNAFGNIPMASTAGKVAIVNSTSLPTSFTDPLIVDFVGYGVTANFYEGTGPTIAPSNTMSVRRKINGTQDTDNNSVDFDTLTPGAGNPPLPVELISFNVDVKGNKISLFWKTAVELNSNLFEIEKAFVSGLPENSQFTKAGAVRANGFSSSPKNYTFIDDCPVSGEYLYRLKIIDNDGSFKYSSVVSVEVMSPNAYSLAQNYPNPFNPSTSISYSLPLESNVKLRIYDAVGNLIREVVNKSEAAGTYNIRFDGNGLSSGIYFYTLTAVSSDGSTSFSNTKKLLLLK